MSSLIQQIKVDSTKREMKVTCSSLIFSIRAFSIRTFAIRVVAAILCLSATNVVAEDRDGAYAVGGGVGSVECSKFVSIIEQARYRWIATMGYVNDANAFAMYLAGFQTAYNHAAPDTCDIFNGVDYDRLLTWIEVYCRTNPSDRFGTATIALANELHPNRLRNCRQQ